MLPSFVLVFLKNNRWGNSSFAKKCKHFSVAYVTAELIQFAFYCLGIHPSRKKQKLSQCYLLQGALPMCDHRHCESHFSANWNVSFIRKNCFLEIKAPHSAICSTHFAIWARTCTRQLRVPWQGLFAEVNMRKIYLTNIDLLLFRLPIITDKHMSIPHQEHHST